MRSPDVRVRAQKPEGGRGADPVFLLLQHVQTEGGAEEGLLRVPPGRELGALRHPVRRGGVLAADVQQEDAGEWSFEDGFLFLRVFVFDFYFIFLGQCDDVEGFDWAPLRKFALYGTFVHGPILIMWYRFCFYCFSLIW